MSTENNKAKKELTRMQTKEQVIDMLREEGYTVLYPKTKGFTKERTRQRMMRHMIAEDVNMVNHPPHYTSKKYEVIDILEEFFKDDPLLWQCGKYLLRCKEKGNMKQDLSKMLWYAKRKIEQDE